MCLINPAHEQSKAPEVKGTGQEKKLMLSDKAQHFDIQYDKPDKLPYPVSAKEFGEPRRYGRVIILRIRFAFHDFLWFRCIF